MTDSTSSLIVPQGSLSVVFMATGPFAVPTFRAMAEPPDRFRILALFTQPPRPQHSRDKQQPAASLMRALAEERELPIYTPDSVNSHAAHDVLRSLAADLFVVCDYGQILAPETLGLARLGGINLHGSLLPKYRGAAPVNWAIYHGETETGVSVIRMTKGLDAGPCLVQRRTPIDLNETAVELEPRLAELGAPAVLEAIELLAGGGPAVGIPQDAQSATKAPRLKKTDGLVDWSRTAAQIRNQVRAFQPWPKTHTFWLRGGAEPLRLILENIAVADEEVVRITLAGQRRPPPGTAISVDKTSLMILCGTGAVLPQIVQPAGKRAMSIGEFIRGNSVHEGDLFGNAE